MAVVTIDIVPSSELSVSTLTPLTPWMLPERGAWDTLLFWAIFQSPQGRLVVETSEDGIAVDAQRYVILQPTSTELQVSHEMSSVRKYYRLQAFSQFASVVLVKYGIAAVSRT